MQLYRIMFSGGFLPRRMKDNVNDFSKYNSILCYNQKYFFERINLILDTAIADYNAPYYSDELQTA